MNNNSKPIWQRKLRLFLKNKTAVTAVIILSLLYLAAIFAPFIAPYSANKNFKEDFFHPPSKLHFFDEDGFSRPFIYKSEAGSGWSEYQLDRSQKYYLKFFSKGEEYKFLGLFKADHHLFQLDGQEPFFLLGSDNFGRDIFSRLLFGARVSLFIAFIAIIITTVIGLIVGGISGYYGGLIDNLIMRAAEVIMSIPSFYLLLALAAVLPIELPSSIRFFMIITILSFQGWAGMARVIRGMVLSVKNEDYILAARAIGADDRKIIFRHILPAATSYVVIRATVAVPGYIIMESGLSFLGLGIQEPAASWGNMLSAAQNITKISSFPWLLLPGLMIFLTVLSYNILGDGLRDALDPKGELS